MRRITYEGRRSGEAYFAPDDRALVFQSEREPGNPFFQIYVMDLTTGDVNRVSPGTGKTTCAFFQPGSDRVLFASTHLDPRAKDKQKAEYEKRASGHASRYGWDYDPAMDIFTARRDGRDLVRLTDAEGYDAEGAFSPDGRRIVFCSLRDAYPADRLDADARRRLEVDPAYFGEIYVMNADGSGQTRLTDWPGYDGGPFFSPDGRRIVWRHFQEDGMIADVWTMRPDGTDRHRVTDFASMCWAPFFHPSGRYLIFTTNRHGFENFELYIVDAEGEHEPVRVTNTPGFDGLPSFSHDGRQLVWTSTRGGDNSQLYLADWDHEAALAAIAASPPRRPATGAGTLEREATRALPDPVRSPDSSVQDDPVDPRFAPAGRLPRGRRLARGRRARPPASSPEITADDACAIVRELADDRYEGRLTGTSAERRAARWIEARMRRAGIEPRGEHGWEQAFPFTSGVKIDRRHNALEVTVGGRTLRFEVQRDYQPLAFSENAETEGDVVFVGYGLKTPEEGADAYDSYAGIDVEGKVALVLRYAPEDVDSDRRAQLNRYAGLRYKAMLAREHGAVAMLVAIGPRSPNAGELTPIRFDQALAGSGIPVFAVSGDVLAMLFEAAPMPIEDVQKGLDEENPHVQGAFALPGVHVHLRAALRRTTSKGHNVIGWIPPGEDAGDDAPIVVLGAHYDHLGHGTSGSLARSGEEGMIHNGADDNASGVAAVLEIAEALADARRADPHGFPAGFVVAAWSGEELGLLGSNWWVEHPTVALERVRACLNFDMVGRLRDNRLVLQGVGSADSWRRLIERRNVAAGFDLVLQNDPYLPTDVVAFYNHEIPVMSFFTGSHEDYHRPTDDADRIDCEGIARIAAFARALAGDVAAGRTELAWKRVERPKGEASTRAAMRVYLGTIPDYAASDVEGVRLAGVRSGGPAELGGLRGGDVIVRFAGHQIRNIYDYTYALDAVKPGDPVEVVVRRGDELVTLTVTPQTRK